MNEYNLVSDDNTPCKSNDEHQTQQYNRSATECLDLPTIRAEVVARAEPKKDAMHQNLKASQKRFDALIAASSDAVYRMNADWTQLYFLQGGGFIANTRHANAQWLDEYVPIEEHDRVLASVNAAVASGDIFEMEHKFWRSDGSSGWMFSRAVPVRNNQGQVIEWFGSVSDFTERKRNQIALEEANKRLLDEEARKNQFIAMLSHEMRNPLAPILASVEILDAIGAQTQMAQRARQTIKRQATHLSDLVNDLLNITRISTGKVLIDQKCLDLATLTKHVCDDYRAGFENSSIALEVAIGGEEMLVIGDEKRLIQIIGNILQNAIKFTPSGGHVWVNLELDADRQHAMLSIEDDGIGLEAEMVSRLFEPFAQADSSLSRSRGGLGLGLALVKTLVQMHNGDVDAGSPGKNKGTTLMVRLPLRAVSNNSIQQEDTRHLQILRTRQCSTLVIDDNVDAANSLCDLLTLHGYQTTPAHSGQEGIAYAKQYKFDAIICDIGLPGMTGYDVAKVLRSEPQSKHAFIVALSGYAHNDHMRLAQEAGFNQYLCKPVQSDILLSLLKGCFERDG